MLTERGVQLCKIELMQNQEPGIVFDKERASTYDKRVAKLAPLHDALHLLTRLILSELPADARILCVNTVQLSLKVM